MIPIILYFFACCHTNSYSYVRSRFTNMHSYLELEVTPQIYAAAMCVYLLLIKSIECWFLHKRNDIICAK